MVEQKIQKFETEYDKLNELQQEAVDTIYGPVLVVAGPGTGKTQILALRIARLLLSDAQVSAQNILCLTFTEEGRKNMRDRLFTLIGAETAPLVSVHTYHSFCNEVIQQHLHLFEKDSLDPVSELEKIQYIKEILLKLDKKHVLYNAKNPNANARYLLSLFSKMKQENWSSDYLYQKTLEEIQRLETDESGISTRGTRKGQLKMEVLNEIERYRKSLQAITLFDEYRNLMLSRHRYDFDDMINWVIRVFTEYPDVLASYHERFQYLLVDEFQDTNGSQLEIVDALSSYDVAPNVFVVGDDDQSIFRFQGASVENMKNFHERYRLHGLKEICLKVNYRSPQGVLEHAKNLIENAGQRLVHLNPELDKNLVSYKTLTNGIDYTPGLLCFHNPRYERIYLANRVKQLVDNGVKAREIAILFYDNNSCLDMCSYLGKAGIPFYTKRNMNLFNDMLAKQILNILSYIAAERKNPYSGDNLLFEILHYRFFNIPAIEIAKAMIQANERISSERKNKYSFRRFLQEELGGQTGSLFVETGVELFRSGVQVMEELIAASHNLSLLQLCDLVVDRCGILQTILGEDTKYEDLEILTALIDFIKEEARRDPEMDVNEFVELLSIMEENELLLPRYKLYGNEDAVRVFTVHASKGHEYEYVFVAGVVKPLWEGRKTPPNTIKIPDSVFQKAESKKDHDELRRMMYVALTRAKKELWVSFYQTDLKEKEVERSQFLYEIFGEDFKPSYPTIEAEQVLEIETSEPGREQAICVAGFEKEFVNRRLENFELNVTALNHYLECPLNFYYNNIVRIPVGVQENMSFGSAIHKALEKLFAEMKEAGEFPPVSRLEDHFIYYMQRNREHFSPSGFERKLDYGLELLQQIYALNVNTWHRIIKTEFKTSAVVRGVPIKGFIDKVEYYGDEIALVDYKTGDYSSPYTKQKLIQGGDARYPEGGDYWRQAMFYKILLDHDPLNKYKATVAKYEFLEPEKKSGLFPKAHQFNFPAEHIDMVMEQISDTWQKIQAHDFYTGCAKPDCRWCSLAKTLQK